MLEFYMVFARKNICILTASANLKGVCDDN